MKKNHIHEARGVISQIEAKLLVNNMELRVNILKGKKLTPHWMFYLGTIQVLHYWPTTGRIRFHGMGDVPEFLSPMQACDLAIQLSRDRARMNSIRKSSVERYEKLSSYREKMFSVDNSERLLESLGDPIHFGKHKGTPWRDVPESYLVWIRDNFSVGSVRDMAKAVLEEIYNISSHTLNHTIDKQARHSVECNPRADRPIEEWDRKFILQYAEKLNPDAAEHSRVMELLSEEAPF